MKFGTLSTGRYTGTDRYTGVAVGRRSTVLVINGLNVPLDAMFALLKFLLCLKLICHGK